MYCIECGAAIEATAKICGACRFPQPLEEFADVEQPQASGSGVTAPRPAFPVSLEQPPKKREKRPRLATAIAAFIALCISTGLSMYLLTRPHASPGTPASQRTTSAQPTPTAPAPPIEASHRDPSANSPPNVQDSAANEPQN